MGVVGESDDRDGVRVIWAGGGGGGGLGAGGLLGPCLGMHVRFGKMRGGIKIERGVQGPNGGRHIKSVGKCETV